jgi:DNA-directed RNA polymerase subunit RPC12/RpoP
MKRSYVKCRKCRLRIQLPYECRFEYPLLFAVKCPRCGFNNVYHRLEVIQGDDKYCEEMNKKAEEFVRPLKEAVILSRLESMIHPVFQTILEIPLKILEKYRGDGGGE